MQKVTLTALARHQLEIARNASSGRSAHTVFGGHEHVMRQTMIALRAGSALQEHENPGEATVHVLRGRVTLVVGEVTWNALSGDLLLIPDARHSLEAVEDSVVLLTVAKVDQRGLRRGPGDGSTAGGSNGHDQPDEPGEPG